MDSNQFISKIYLKLVSRSIHLTLYLIEMILKTDKSTVINS